MALRDTTVAKVRSVPMTDVLSGEQIAFKRVGREAVTICPWHNDTNPSLTINDDKGICFCFACGGGSDSIAYVQQRFSLGFADAVLRIAEKHGIQAEYDDLDPAEALKQRQARQQVLERVSQEHGRFRAALKGDAGLEARQWLSGRGITPETSKTFELGLATSGYFQGRISVPIHNHRGTLVGFTGRRISENVEPKYKNSASSDVFDKGALLFNEHRAAEAARESGYMIFVEGHFDAISLHQYGMRNVVATQGTAGPTIHSLNRLLRYCRTLVLCYDGDDGGFKATENFVKVAGKLACSGELTLTVAQLPAGQDPEDCIKSGVDLHALIEAAPQWLDWTIDRWLNELDRSDTFRFSQVEQALRQLVESIKSPALRQYYIDKSSKALASDAKAAAKLAQSWNSSLPKGRSQKRWDRPEAPWVQYQAERRLLRCYLHFPETRTRLKGLTGSIKSPAHSWLWQRIQELESFCPGWDCKTMMAVLAVAEPHYLRTLRSLVMPTIKLGSQVGILDHMEAVLASGNQ
jgi:DNA primase